MNPILRLCDSCRFYNPDAGTCKAFPEGVPLKSSEGHFEVLPGQVGDTIYDMDPSLYDLFEMYRRVHPEVRFPLIITYDVPESADEVFEQQDVEVENGDTQDS